MRHPELERRERAAAFRALRNRYWWRWMGAFCLGLAAVLALIYAAGGVDRPAVLLVVVCALFTVAIALFAWLADRRARQDQGERADGIRGGAASR